MHARYRLPHVAAGSREGFKIDHDQFCIDCYIWSTDIVLMLRKEPDVLAAAVNKR
jgi:hypothetical protein